MSKRLSTLMRNHPQHHPGQVLGLTLVLLLGMAIYIHGFVQTLPYQLEPDEPNIWIFTNTLVTTGKFVSFYPPLRLIELALEHHLIHLITPPGHLAQPVYYVVGRYFTVLYGMLLLSATYQTGRHLHSRAAGLAAMLFLIAQPDAIHLTKLFKVDNFAWLFGMTSLMLALRTVQKDRPWLVMVSMGMGLLAVLGKYSMLPLLIVPVLLMITYVPRQPHVRAATIGAGVVLFAVTVYLLFNPPAFIEPLLRFTRITREFYERERLLQFVSWESNWPKLVEALGPVNLGVVIMGLPFAAFVWPRATLTRKQWLLLVALITMMVSCYLWLALLPLNRPQDRYAIVLGFILIWGTTLAMLFQQRRELSGATALVLMMPWLASGWQYGTDLRQPDTRAMTAEWFIANVPEGTHIAVEKDFVEFNRSYGGFPSDKVFFVKEIDSVYEHPLGDFARAGVEYLVADYRNIWRGGFFQPDRDNSLLLAQVETVLDLSAPWDKGWQGPERYVFRIPPAQQVPMHVFLGDEIIFKGYDLPSDAVSPGETLDLTLYWTALRETDANYIVFAHLVSADGMLAAQLDGPPGDALHRTYDWWPGYFDWDEWPIPVPVDVPPGVYMLRIGMYDTDTAIRLLTFSADREPLGDDIALAHITVREEP